MSDSITITPYGNYYIIEVLHTKEEDDEYCGKIHKKGTFNSEHLNVGTIVWYKGEGIMKKVFKDNKEYHVVSKHKFFMFSNGGK